MRKTLACAVAVGVAALLLAPPAGGLYLYVPDVVVIATPADADDWLNATELSMGVQPSDDPLYAQHPELKRLDRTAALLQKHWSKLDAACDANAVFALMYLVMTWNVRDHVREGYFADNGYLATITVVFASLYLQAWDHWTKGDLAHVQKGWQEAFAFAGSHGSNVTQDEFLGINAHVNYDLAVAIASLGTTDANGNSRKPDMDRINHVLVDATDDVGYFEALYYGPSPPTALYTKDESTPAAQTASWLTIEPIAGWREGAWQNAVIIEGTPTSTERAVHDAAMQQAAWTVAQGFETPMGIDTWPARLAYCQANPPAGYAGPTVEHPL